MITDTRYYIVCVFFSCFVQAIPLNYSNYKPGVKVDPDFYRNVSQLITSKGYPVEEYWVQTEDGYILGVQRIPQGRADPEPSSKTRPVVFLQQGLLSSSADWVMNFPNESLGFILADAGYDVWLGNQRGNTYSRKHVKYSPRDKEFWQFSFDEFAKYDLPAMIDFALNVTNQSQLYYVGHSEGTTVAFALLSERPEYDKIKVVVALGPVATVGYITSPIRYLAPFAPILDPLFRLFGFYEFLPNDLIMKLLARFVCGNRELQFLCENVAFLISGFDPSELNKTRLEVYTAHFPAGTSTQNVIHYAQMVNSRNFQKYDYGKTKNMKKYNRTTPPEYNVENIRTPVALFYALNDCLADPVDVSLLRLKLKNLVECYRVSLPTWAHIDFVIGVDAPVYVYKEVMRIMQKVVASWFKHMIDKSGINMQCTAFCFLVLCWGLTICSASSSRVRDVDLDANRNVTQLITSRGYPVKEYTVRTRDGYLLKLFRIPYGRKNRRRNTRNRRVAFLQHGFLGSASDWVINFPSQSLGYILADEGYDVWLGNQRGNIYARRHVRYSPQSNRFWDFSINEHAKYDTPNSIDFVLKKTGQRQLYYVGWSQGCMIAFAFLSEKPRYNKIKAIFALAPTATVGYIQSPIRYLAPLSNNFRLLFSALGQRELLPNNYITRLFAQSVCSSPLNSVCSNLYFQINGYDFRQLNESRLPVYFSHLPAGTSTKTLIHYGQMVNSKKFQKFDYGRKKNMKKYKQAYPPEYKLGKIRTPIAIFKGLNDKLANPKDVGILGSRIPNKLADYQVSLREWGHLDFVYATDTKKYVYDPVVRIMKTV
ncbi:uncharacterized protein [Centruroides vittatus]|uniref:uncharacterized protein n=1 Tax=Centruroides vittatus TaxID=120091 RepID=UPI00350FB10E